MDSIEQISFIGASVKPKYTKIVDFFIIDLFYLRSLFIIDLGKFLFTNF